MSAYYMSPTVEFELPTTPEEAEVLGSIIKHFIVEGVGYAYEGTVGIQPYADEPAYSGLKFTRQSWDELLAECAEREREIPAVMEFTGWWITFTYWDSMTNVFTSPVLRHQDGFVTWEY
jgi:hypothetical protein